MGCFAPDAPEPRNYGQETRDTLQAQIDLAPDLYRTEAQFQPQYSQLALQNLNTILNGGNGQTGLLQTLRQQNTAQRTADINDVAALGGSAREAILGANPDQAALLQRLNAQALTGLDAGTNLTPEEQRQMQQASRGAFAARGLEDSNLGISNELLSQYNLGQQLLRQRQAFAQSVLGNNQAIVGDPFLQILGRPSTAVMQGQGLLGEAGPSLFNPESGYAGNLYNANQQMAAMFAEPSTMAKVGQVSNAAGQFIGGIAGAMI